MIDAFDSIRTVTKRGVSRLEDVSVHGFHQPSGLRHSGTHLAGEGACCGIIDTRNALSIPDG